MPELPEVETVARDLRRELAAQTFVGVEVLWPRTVAQPDVATFCACLTGATVTDVGRRGKFITLSLDSGQTLLAHLRMTGQFHFRPHKTRHVRVRFELAGGRVLFFSDPRKFGRLYLVDDPAEIVGGLGPEPLDADFTPERLAAMLAGRRRQLKPLLLDQRFLAGLGNIYADEALWRARVHPLRLANTLTGDEAARLHAAIVSVLREALEHEGTTLRNYCQPDGAAGAFQALLSVYGRADQPCPRCGTMIKRIVVGQRGTHICPSCQSNRGDE